MKQWYSRSTVRDFIMVFPASGKQKIPSSFARMRCIAITHLRITNCACGRYMQWLLLYLIIIALAALSTSRTMANTVSRKNEDTSHSLPVTSPNAVRFSKFCDDTSLLEIPQDPAMSVPNFWTLTGQWARFLCLAVIWQWPNGNNPLLYCCTKGTERCR